MEENMKKIKEKENDLKARQQEEEHKKHEEELREKKKPKLEDILDKDKAQTYKSKIEKLNPMEKVERLITATRETTDSILNPTRGVKKTKKDVDLSNNELAKNLVKQPKKRSTTPVKANNKRDLNSDLDLNTNYSKKRPKRNLSNEDKQDKNEKNEPKEILPSKTTKYD